MGYKNITMKYSSETLKLDSKSRTENLFILSLCPDIIQTLLMSKVLSIGHLFFLWGAGLEFLSPLETPALGLEKWPFSILCC